MKLSEKTKTVIALADAVLTYWDTELPKQYRDYPFVHPGEDQSLRPPPQEKQLRDLLSALPDDMIYQLFLLTYLGRGDFGADDLANNYQAVKDSVGRPDELTSQLIYKSLLAGYLGDGLAELEKSGIDVDDLNLTSRTAWPIQYPQPGEC